MMQPIDTSPHTEPTHTETHVRRPETADDEAIAALFDSTLALGEPLGFDLARIAAYRRLCLGWYLGPGRDDAAVAVDAANRVVGYALVCTDEAAYERWMRPLAHRFIAGTFVALLTARLDRPSTRFYYDRARDAFALRDNHRMRPMPAHAHLNVGRTQRSGSIALALRDHIDARCRLAGHPGWSGEINARAGTRRRALERIGLEVVSSEVNHTLSRTLGTEVIRLTVVRHLR